LKRGLPFRSICDKSNNNGGGITHLYNTQFALETLTAYPPWYILNQLEPRWNIVIAAAVIADLRD
jgi:hypothetical protein